MKKLFCIFLLMLLPLQFSWAAAAAYCQHEEAPATRHYGHHQHQHPVKAESPDSKDKLAQVHGDCGYCHGLGQVSFLTASSPMVVSPGSTTIEPHPFSYSSHIPDGPRRPDRHPVA